MHIYNISFDLAMKFQLNVILKQEAQGACVTHLVLTNPLGFVFVCLFLFPFISSSKSYINWHKIWCWQL